MFRDIGRARLLREARFLSRGGAQDCSGGAGHAPAGPAAVNLGAGKQVWHFNALAYTNHLNYNGTVNATSAATYRTNLRAAHAKAAALAFTDRLGAEHSVHMVTLEERIAEAAGFWEQPEWEMAVTLVEA